MAKNHPQALGLCESPVKVNKPMNFWCPSSAESSGILGHLGTWRFVDPILGGCLGIPKHFLGGRNFWWLTEIPVAINHKMSQVW